MFRNQNLVQVLSLNDDNYSNSAYARQSHETIKIHKIEHYYNNYPSLGGQQLQIKDTH